MTKEIGASPLLSEATAAMLDGGRWALRDLGEFAVRGRQPGRIFATAESSPAAASR
ncbi:MAG: hypothetical protein R3F11_20865 [Verrucomicrobiales bacterium]